jgi:hypothetical protein
MPEVTDSTNYIEQAIYLLLKQTERYASNGEPYVSDIERAAIEKVCAGLRADSYYIENSANYFAYKAEFEERMGLTEEEYESARMTAPRSKA